VLPGGGREGASGEAPQKALSAAAGPRVVAAGRERVHQQDLPLLLQCSAWPPVRVKAQHLAGAFRLSRGESTADGQELGALLGEVIAG